MEVSDLQAAWLFKSVRAVLLATILLFRFCGLPIGSIVVPFWVYLIGS